ncbi:TOBE domain protein [Roseisalinus antarcticus]|uniref:TOBE domain protein n=1 Tax=Roseisalinus antarcticus TaxID=254357 RepID=A0A1Y5TNP6_9RHOB|nr:TOBE domain protein [Roseisalinus antarcticus]
MPGLDAGGATRLMARPEQIDIVAPDADGVHLPGKILSRYFNGGHMDYRIASDAGEIAVHASTAQDWAPGTAVGLRFDPDRLWPLEGA